MHARDGLSRSFAPSWPLLALLAVFVAAPVLLLGEFSAADTRQRFRAAELRTTADLATRAAEIVASHVLETRNQIARLRGTQIQNNELRQALSDDDIPTAAQAVQLAHVVAGFDVIRLFVVGPDSKVLVADPPEAHRGEDLGSAEYVRSALSEVEARVRAVYAQGAGGDALPIAAISAQFFFAARPGLTPIPATPGEVFSRRVLVAELDLSRSTEWLKPLLGVASEIYLIDATGRLIARARGGTGETLRDLRATPLVAAALAGNAPPGEGADPLSGATRLAASSIVPELGWAVLVTRDVDARSRELEDALRLRSAVLALVAVVLVAGGFVLVRGIRQ